MISKFMRLAFNPAFERAAVSIPRACAARAVDCLFGYDSTSAAVTRLKQGYFSVGFWAVLIFMTTAISGCTNSIVEMGAERAIEEKKVEFLEDGGIHAFLCGTGIPFSIKARRRMHGDSRRWPIHLGRCRARVLGKYRG